MYQSVATSILFHALVGRFRRGTAEPIATQLAPATNCPDGTSSTRADVAKAGKGEACE
eukprot:CAMPEP_0178472492 /NCGR_PEP_ID=MMETSP0696-20121128/1596_1 /TAXON_ID=265572 /ORGANISM="Extubocellulus spinifer, Strain CCMP396" /LENGTH=57 /DNA_ID=CAMNT_0020099679 /DNA_START=438 /DNA_END=611 /DNA_ORIENTATION=-